jgi:hypothetical protein
MHCAILDGLGDGFTKEDDVGFYDRVLDALNFAVFA